MKAKGQTGAIISMVDHSISIAMATFNGQPYLSEQLASLLNQTVRPLELVVCDDGSTDETIGILEAFAVDAPFPVRIFRNPERLGYSANFMKAAGLCQGELIAFCDQDDIWAQEKIEVATEHFKRSGNLAATHDYTIFYADGRPEIPSYFSYLEGFGYSTAINIKGCTLIFRQALIDRVGWPPRQSGWSHDLWVCFTAAMLDARGYIRQPLIKHRIHGNNTSGRLVAKSRLFGRLLRRVDIAPFTSRAEIDRFVAYFGSLDYALISQMIASKGIILTEIERGRISACLGQRSDVAGFIASETYGHPVRRAVTALRLFARRSYRSSDGLLGFLLDVAGRRRPAVN